MQGLYSALTGIVPSHRIPLEQWGMPALFPVAHY